MRWGADRRTGWLRVLVLALTACGGPTWVPRDAGEQFAREQPRPTSDPGRAVIMRPLLARTTVADGLWLIVAFPPRSGPASQRAGGMPEVDWWKTVASLRVRMQDPAGQTHLLVPAPDSVRGAWLTRDNVEWPLLALRVTEDGLTTGGVVHVAPPPAPTPALAPAPGQPHPDPEPELEIEPEPVPPVPAAQRGPPVARWREPLPRGHLARPGTYFFEVSGTLAGARAPVHFTTSVVPVAVLPSSPVHLPAAALQDRAAAAVTGHLARRTERRYPDDSHWQKVRLIDLPDGSRAVMRRGPWLDLEHSRPYYDTFLVRLRPDGSVLQVIQRMDNDFIRHSPWGELFGWAVPEAFQPDPP